MSRAGVPALALALLAGAAPGSAGCDRSGSSGQRGDAAAGASPGAAGGAATALASLGDATRGRALVDQFECNRCHALTDVASPPPLKDCVGCHAQIRDDKLAGAADAHTLTRWKQVTAGLADIPSLERIGGRLRRDWVASFLLAPHDLRPKLAPTMPRLDIDAVQARDVAAYLARGETRAASFDLTSADLGHGREVLDKKGCGTCHAFGGVQPLAASPVGAAMTTKAFSRASLLAPDLRVTRERMTEASVVAWLRDPQAVMPGASMPEIPLDEREIRDAAAYILRVPLSAPVTRPAFVRLPPLERKVRFDEVDKRVFHKTCWHCHSEPDYAIGDGGPGNSGGYGFRPRGLNLSGYKGIAAGLLDKVNERHSVFEKDATGVPRLVAALVARHAEERGLTTGAVRGMPLGLPALAPEDIQLVESWVEQGRPR